MYQKYSEKSGLTAVVEKEKEGDILLRISGVDAKRKLAKESGKHVVQRVPPTERNGRRQTSVCMVAILPIPDAGDFKMLESDVEIFTKRGSGPGGQHRNKTESCVVARHTPTMIEVKVDARNQQTNRQVALRELESRLRDVFDSARKRDYDKLRASQMAGNGSDIGGRGDKIRTYNFCESRCVDHRSGKATKDIKSIMNGQLDLVL